MITYNTMVKVTIDNSQEGISYVLVSASDTTSLSEPVLGNTGKITLLSKALTEDVELQVQAYRTENTNSAALLTTNLWVLVRPDRSVAIRVTTALIDYNARATLQLDHAQASADYHLYRRNLLPSDYVTNETPGRLAVPGMPETTVYIQAPQRITDNMNPIDLTLVGTFEQQGNPRSITTDALTEDTLCIVLATKDNQQLQLDQVVVILVRPDPQPIVTVEQSPIPANNTGIVTVSGTQRGVYYQLRHDLDKLINPPGYDYRDRGIETIRIEVDFVIEEPIEPLLRLPTESVTVKTTYEILATKSLSGVSIPLSGTATIEIGAATPNTTNTDPASGSP
jgi:hypothetical protein